jgi:hypothetical protein
VSLKIAYWVVPEIPTEDRAELIGAVGLHEDLAVQSVNAAGRIELVSANGERPQMTGRDSVSKRLSNLLSEDDNSTFRKWAHSSAALPSATPEVEAFRKETAPIRDGIFRLLELKHDPNSIKAIGQSKAPLTGAEIQFLTDKGMFEEPFLAKVRHVLLTASVDDWRLIDAAATFVASACPALASGMPTDCSPADLQTWWRQKLGTKAPKRTKS